MSPSLMERKTACGSWFVLRRRIISATSASDLVHRYLKSSWRSSKSLFIFSCLRFRARMRVSPGPTSYSHSAPWLRQRVHFGLAPSHCSLVNLASFYLWQQKIPATSAYFDFLASTHATGDRNYCPPWDAHRTCSDRCNACPRRIGFRKQLRQVCMALYAEQGRPLGVHWRLLTSASDMNE